MKAARLEKRTTCTTCVTVCKWFEKQKKRIPIKESCLKHRVKMLIESTEASID